MFERVQPLLPRVLKPARYIGNEFNIVIKDIKKVDLRLVLSYPDIYEIGMSNLGLRILYDAVNRVPNFFCERVFSPWVDFERLLRERDIPLYSLETYTPLKEFDLLGFSIGYELLYTNMLTILELSKIPLYSKERGEKDPLVLAGGPVVYNPEPIADFIDVFIIGDGELSLIEFLNSYREIKKLSREEKLKRMNLFDFTYIPSLYKTKGRKGYTVTDIDKRVKRRIEPDLNKLPIPSKPIVPLIKIVQDRINLEVSRGCVAGCRFCQAGFTYRPVRERNINNILGIIEESIKQTGYDEITLSSLSIGDYSQLRTLLTEIIENFSEKNVSVSLPSLRVDSTNIDILKMAGSVRRSGLTFAIESADEGIRRVINKSVNEDQLLEVVRQVSLAGWRSVKLYFMIGLPMADNEGERIIELMDRLLNLRPKISFNQNVSVFVPKPHTPFEGEKQIELEEAERILKKIRQRFRNTRVKVKFQSPKMSLIEGILSRGDRKISGLIYEVYRQGERFSSWDGVFNYELWIKALEKLQISKEQYLKFDIPIDELPWKFMDIGMDKKFFLTEQRKAKEAIPTENCMYEGCPYCGVCNDLLKNLFARERVSGCNEKEEKPLKTQVKNPGIGGKYGHYKIIFQFKKGGIFRFISHLDLYMLLMRVGRAQGIPFRYTEGFNPKPRLIVPFPLPLGIESDYELGEAFLESPMDEKSFLELFSEKLNNGLKIERARVDNEKGSIASKPYFHDYQIIPYGKFSNQTAFLTDTILRKDVFDDSPITFLTVIGDGIYVRLEGSRSIKTLIPEDKFYVDFSIKRLKIWGKKEGKLENFI